MRHTCEQCIPLGPSYMYYTVVGDLIHDAPRAHSNTQPYDIVVTLLPIDTNTPTTRTHFYKHITNNLDIGF